MARPIDPQRHRARRLHIIDAGLTVFARLGYHRATTAAICGEAGIGSGTFFHYFPTKDSLAVAILREGAAETTAFFAEQEGRSDAAGVLFDYVRHALDDLSDPRAAGFITAISGLGAHEEITTVLQDEESVVRENLTSWVERAQRDGQIRDDLSVERITEWILLLCEGFASRVTASARFDVASERPLLLQLLSRFLAQPPERCECPQPGPGTERT
ncbi:TetR/AcrR family transcriptional regulator [Nesterenkonia ebinurensis]|uniref:TetR/AcrR family transcriptional regulator n=1 Tax=Nesterenkonia ebinurensis TaxID=2608252 RepID=UPI00123DB567|nr:TetR/AcrR family transcriptional regulator [Nesterenkonia ebinurensis]